MQRVDRRPDVKLCLLAQEFDELIEMLALLQELAMEYSNPENATIAKRLGLYFVQQGNLQEHKPCV